MQVRSSASQPRGQECPHFNDTDEDPCSDPVNRGRQGLAYWKEKALGLEGIDVGAVRVATFGWEGWILNALKVSC